MLRFNLVYLNLFFNSSFLFKFLIAKKYNYANISSATQSR